jgi:hypothetical protein
MTMLNGVEKMHTIKEKIEFDSNGMIKGRIKALKTKLKVKKDEEREE